MILALYKIFISVSLLSEPSFHIFMFFLKTDEKIHFMHHVSLNPIKSQKRVSQCDIEKWYAISVWCLPISRLVFHVLLVHRKEWTNFLKSLNIFQRQLSRASIDFIIKNFLQKIIHIHSTSYSFHYKMGCIKLHTLAN